MKQPTRNAWQLGYIGFMTLLGVLVFAEDIMHGSFRATIMAVALVWFSITGIAQVRRYRRDGQHVLADALLGWIAGAAAMLWLLADFGQLRLESAREDADACVAESR